ncbi:MAG TPA: hypothetical protein VJN19_02345 [Propionibacteriaceae bacterium]|nr:hypothetical protein [Propionibacteriaceae bacterium]
MSATSRVAGAVAAGYVLGRFKKLRLAVLVASAMASPKFRSAAAGLIQDRIPGGVIVGGLTKEVGGRLLDAGKAAATTVVAARIDTLSQNLADRSENLRKTTPGAQAGKPRADRATEDRASEEPMDEYEEPEVEETEEPEGEYREPEEEETEEPEGEYREPEDEEAEELEGEYEPEEPVVPSRRRRRSASPAGRRRG